jgi:hypothetical protein
MNRNWRLNANVPAKNKLQKAFGAEHLKMQFGDFTVLT